MIPMSVADKRLSFHSLRRNARAAGDGVRAARASYASVQALGLHVLGALTLQLSLACLLRFKRLSSS